MFEITFLGTASAVPTIARNLPSIAVRHEGDFFLLDCGEGTQRQMLMHGVSCMKVKAIFISHPHLDHLTGVSGLVETMALGGRTEPLAIYCPKEASRFFVKKNFVQIVEIGGHLTWDFGKFEARAFPNLHTKPSFGFVFEEKEKIRFFEQKAKAAGIRGPMFSEIMRKGEIAVGGKKIKLKDVTYRQAGKKIVYSGDTAPCQAVAKAAKDADLLIHEATFCSDRQEEAKKSRHSTAIQAAEVAKKAGAKKLALTHISARYPDPSAILAEAKQVFENCIVAEDGMKIKI
ncbi:MAG: ribonuclease Z [Candidatus Micrarchaeota archaeon]|nr:ribonuclease Z [Candidatus Micrarchaeota archaeon]